MNLELKQKASTDSGQTCWDESWDDMTKAVQPLDENTSKLDSLRFSKKWINVYEGWIVEK